MKRVDKRLDERLGGLYDRMTGLESRMDGLYEGLNAKMDGLNIKMDAVLNAISVFSRAYEKSQELYTNVLKDLGYIKERLDSRIGFARKDEESEKS